MDSILKLTHFHQLYNQKIPEQEDLLKLSSDVRKRREALAEDVRLEHGQSEVQIKGCLRETLAGAQRVDPALAKLMQN